MKFLSFQKERPAIPDATDRVVLHLYALGGSGAILGLVTLIQMLSMDDSPTRFDLRVNAMDFDANSDAHALLMQTTEVLCSMLVDLSKERDTEYGFAFEYAGQETALVSISVNSGKTIFNELLRGRVDGAKVGEKPEGGENVKLAGAVMGLFKPDTEDFTEENALLTVATAEDGSFAFENIPYQGTGGLPA